MFELNLIRERTLLRARRKVVGWFSVGIFLIFSLAALGLVYLYLEELGFTREHQANIDGLSAQIQSLESKLANWDELRTQRNDEVNTYKTTAYLFFPYKEFETPPKSSDDQEGSSSLSKEPPLKISQENRDLFTQVLIELSDFSGEVQDDDANTEPRRWFTEIRISRPTLKDSSRQKIYSLGNLNAFVKYQAIFLGTDDMHVSQGEEALQFWNDNSYLYSSLGKAIPTKQPRTIDSRVIPRSENEEFFNESRLWHIEHSFDTQHKRSSGR